MLAFFLGSHPAISLAEIRTVFQSKELHTSETIAVFDIEDDVVAKSFFRLGGVPRYGIVLSNAFSVADQEAVLKLLIDALQKKEKKGYVVSLYGVRLDKKDLHSELKARLPGAKYEGNINEARHSPASVSHLSSRGGTEFVLAELGGRSYLIEVIKTQDIKHWSILDAERPGRDMKIGILPAKLARIMVNLANMPAEGVIWDPFVGQATIPMQAAILGLRSYGTDISSMSIQKGKQNMSWLESKGLAKNGSTSLKIGDIEKSFPPMPITAVVTEPFLGTARYKPFSSEFLAKREWRNISKLYDTLLRVSARNLRHGQRLVAVKPIFSYIASKQIQWYNPALTIKADTWRVPELLKDLGALIWTQHDSVVGRELLILEKR